jgi:biotin transporter BioY
MSSNIKHIVEPTVGWLFVFVLIVALCAALVAPTRPTMEATGPGRIQVDRAH